VGRRFFGSGPALVGTAVAAFSPDLMAHAGLATEDVVCAATMFAAVATFERAARGRRPRDWALCGAATGLALLAKYTSLLLLPAYVLSFAWLRRRTRPVASMREAAVAFGIVAGVAAVVVGAGYNFSFDLGHYVRGLRGLYGDLSGTYYHYLLGRISETAWPHYHVVAFLLKTPLPILALMGWAAVRGATDRPRRDAVVLLLVPPALIFTASLFDHANFGVRRVLPAFPFLFAFTSLAAAGETRRHARLALALLVLWCGVEAARAFPHPLSYFHQAAGGVERGPYLLDDSNLDWGQDLPALARWQSEHPEARPLRLSYFGTADPAAWGVEAVEMSREEVDRPGSGWYAVSAHQLVYFRKLRLLRGQGVDWLESFEPVARAGGSIWIYRFD
jgi:4-amino-4-deoxy-L-arabinose transferase-like glycosyltransferase